MKKLFLLVSVFSFFNVQSQIVIDNTAPYNTPVFLIDNVLLGGGVIATNHSFIGDSRQIGFFNGINSNLGIDSGIVLSSSDVADIVGPNNSSGTSNSLAPFPYLPGDATLDALLYDIYLNTVPLPFSPDSTKEAAVLEFDFIPTSDTLSFKYVFASEEYLEFVNQFNDAFGFFLTGPNPAGGNYVNQNLAIVPGTVNTPVTINNVNDVVNSAYYIANGDGFTVPQNTDSTVIQFDGFTTPLTAIAAVNCGDIYHIKLVVADVNDGGWDSGVFLEAGSFYSPLLEIADNLGIDSAFMSIPCNSTVTLTASGGVGATYQWFDSTSTVFDTDSSVIVGEGVYIVSADISGCPVLSDTLRVIEGDSPTFGLGNDTIIACNSSYLLTPNILGGTPPYVYLWSNGSTLNSQTLGEGDYDLIVSDLFSCGDTSSISISYDPPPVLDLGLGYDIACNTTTTLIPNIVGGTLPYSYTWNDGSINSSLDVSGGNFSLTITDFWNCSDSDNIFIGEGNPGTITLSGGGKICNNGINTVDVNFNFNGLLPWNLEFTNGINNQTIQGITSSNYLVTTSNQGIYDIVAASDTNDCLANIVGSAQVIVHPLPIANITPAESFIYEGETIELEVGDYAMYQWYNTEGLNLDTLSKLTVSDSGTYYVSVKDVNGCEDVSDVAIVNVVPITQLFVPNSFTPNGDDHNELFVIKGIHVIDFKLKIFDRWGEQLFESDSIDKYWDGTFESNKVQQGTYFYNIEVYGEDGDLFVKSGRVNVIY